MKCRFPLCLLSGETFFLQLFHIYCNLCLTYFQLVFQLTHAIRRYSLIINRTPMALPLGQGQLAYLPINATPTGECLNVSPQLFFLNTIAPAPLPCTSMLPHWHFIRNDNKFYFVQKKRKNYKKNYNKTKRSKAEYKWINKRVEIVKIFQFKHNNNNNCNTW